MQVMWDPTDVYPRGGLFAHTDFNHTLKGGVWPNGMIVKDLRNDQCYEVVDTEKIEVPD
ncbi:hypothetical protein LCGC14_2563660, partial [marine sediment metagenome]